jgi:hypothetical protein
MGATPRGNPLPAFPLSTCWVLHDGLAFSFSINLNKTSSSHRQLPGSFKKRLGSTYHEGALHKVKASSLKPKANIIYL